MESKGHMSHILCRAYDLRWVSERVEAPREYSKVLRKLQKSLTDELAHDMTTRHFDLRTLPKIMAFHGIKAFRVVKTRADGDCLYRCFAKMVQAELPETSTASEDDIVTALRNRTEDVIEKCAEVNPEIADMLRERFEMPEEDEDGNRRSRRDTKAKPFEAMDTIHILATLLQVDVLVVFKEEQRGRRRAAPRSAAPYRSVLYSSDALLTLLSGMLLGSWEAESVPEDLGAELDRRAQVLGEFMGRAALVDEAGAGGEGGEGGGSLLALQGSRGLMVIHGSSLSATNQAGHFDTFTVPKRIGKIEPGASELDRHINLERMLSLAITGTLHTTIDDRETRQLFARSPLRLGTSLVITPDLSLEFIQPPAPSAILGLMKSPSSDPITRPFTSSIFCLCRNDDRDPTMELDAETHEVKWTEHTLLAKTGAARLTLASIVPLPGPLTLPPPFSPLDRVLTLPEAQVDDVAVLEGTLIPEEEQQAAAGAASSDTLIRNSQRLWTRENTLREMSDQERAKVAGALVVRESSIPASGLGLFAARRIPRGVRLGAYTGMCFESVEQLEAYRTAHGLPIPSGYVFEAANSACRLIDGDYAAYPDKACVLAFMNHNPQKANVRFTAKGNVEAKQDIGPGQEIFVSYGKSYRMHIRRHIRHTATARQPSPSTLPFAQTPATAFTSGMSLRLDRSLLGPFKDLSIMSGGASVDGNIPFPNLDSVSPTAEPRKTVNLRVYTRQAPHVHDLKGVDVEDAVRAVAEAIIMPSSAQEAAPPRLVFAFNGMTATTDKLLLLGELLGGDDFVEVVFMSDCVQYVANADEAGNFPIHLPAAVQGSVASSSIFSDDAVAAAACASYLDARWRKEISRTWEAEGERFDSPDSRQKLLLLAGYGAGRRLASYMLHMTEGRAKAEAVFDMGRLIDIKEPGNFVEAFGRSWSSLTSVSSQSHNDVLLVKGWAAAGEGGVDDDDDAERLLDGYACVGLLFDEEDDDGLLFLQTDVGKCIEASVSGHQESLIRQNVPPTPSVPLPLARYSVWVRRDLPGFAPVTELRFAKRTRDLWTTPNFHHLRGKFETLTPELLSVLRGGAVEAGADAEAVAGLPLGPMLIKHRLPVCVQLFSNPERGVRGWFLASQAFRARASASCPILCPRIRRIAHIPTSRHTHLFAVTISGRASRSLLSSIMSAVLVGEGGGEPVLSDLVRRMVAQMPEEDVARLPVEIRENVDAVLRVERHECTGRGLFAKSAIRKDTFLGHYTGHLQSTKARGNEWYVWDLGSSRTAGEEGGRYVDGDYTKWQEAGYLSLMNTGPDPNVEGVLGTDADGEPALRYVAIRDIGPGEQLLIDYGPSYLDFITARYEDALFRARRAMAWTARCLAAFQRMRVGIATGSSTVRQVAEDWLVKTVRILDEVALEADHVDVSWPGSMVTCTGMWDRVVHPDLDKGVETVDSMEMLGAMAQVIVDKLVECAAGSVPFEPRHQVDKLVRVATRVLAEGMVATEEQNAVSITDASDLLKPVDGMVVDLQAFVRLAVELGMGPVPGSDYTELLEVTVNLDHRPDEPFGALVLSNSGDWMTKAEATMQTTLDLAIRLIRNEIPRSMKTFRPLAIYRVTPHFALVEDLPLVEANSREVDDPERLALFLGDTMFGDVPLDNLRFLEGQTSRGVIFVLS